MYSMLDEEVDVMGMHICKLFYFNSFQKYGRTIFGQI